MSSVRVDPSEMTQLLKYQEEARMQVQAGFRATHGIGNRLWQSHGVVSHASNTSLTDKEAERDTAGNTFIHACSTLIRVLDSYQNAYINTDQGSARRISNWV